MVMSEIVHLLFKIVRLWLYFLCKIAILSFDADKIWSDCLILEKFFVLLRRSFMQTKAGQTRTNQPLKGLPSRTP
jgi:hypothetical protein